MKNKFNLMSLPLCGAKTRSGASCKRRGNKRNGRCKLHGGNSTGAKTEEGKMASRVNALKTFPSWYFGEPTPCHYINRAYNTFNQLVEVVNTKPIDWPHIFNLVKRDRIPLEMLKYHIMTKSSPENFIMLQSILDAYYQEYNSKHLAFTLYAPIQELSQYHYPLSRPQREYLDHWLTHHYKKTFNH